MNLKLDSPVQYIKGVGPRRAALLERLGLKTVEDLLTHFPLRYEDRRNIKPIASLMEGETQTFRGHIVSANVSKAHGGRRIFTLSIRDETGSISAVWFSVRGDYLEKKYPPGAEVLATGRIYQSRFKRSLEVSHPDIEVLEEGEEPHGGILPLYPLTEGIKQKAMQSIIASVLPVADGMEDPLPAQLLEKLKLPGRGEAVRLIHSPPEDTSPETLERFRTRAHKRMIFEELFLIECAMAVLRNRNTENAKGVRISAGEEVLERIKARLPFRLTADQEKVLEEIKEDLAGPHPMNRLLQGDVGCGKTVVAAITAALAIAGGYQAVIMAPTEILAEQHYRNITAMKDAFRMNTALLTSGTKEKDGIKEAAKNGEMDLLVGTHALIQQDVEFRNLGVAVIDEQHRFGVRQRGELIKKGESPNTLIMTATPIPRTLAMTVYGDLDISSIRTMPSGRGEMETRVIRPNDMQKAHLLMHREIKEGRQAYIIYPLVEESEKSELKAAREMWEIYQKKIFPDLRVGLVHGRMKQEEKNDVMHAFKEGAIDILVSTTVVEVGIDQPNATVIMVEHSERFGLAQLHQLRGRVGRGRHKSYCLLAIEYPISDVARERLKVMTRTTDGFVIAEKDMELRGAGDILGTRQSGLPALKMANLFRDYEILKVAKKEAFEHIKRDPALASPESSALRKKLSDSWKERFSLAEIG